MSIQKKRLFIPIFIAVLVVSNVLTLYVSNKIHNEKMSQVTSSLSQANEQLQIYRAKTDEMSNVIEENNSVNNQIEKYIDLLNKDEYKQDNRSYYIKDDEIYAMNAADGSYVVYGEPSSIYKDYSELVDKFIKLYDNTKAKITDKDLEDAGFNANHINTYGFAPFLLL
jgi:DNA repair exonuclease SbcCD ATPase subunit